jgi:hypothetical protein
MVRRWLGDGGEGQRLLSELERSSWAAPQECEGMSDTEREELKAALNRAVAEHRVWEDRIRRLAQLRYKPAVPAIIALWRGCPVTPVRVSTPAEN